MDPITLSNALSIHRPELGDTVGVGLFRLVRLVALEDILGTGASAVIYYAGKRLGKSLELTSLDSFLALCQDLKIGLIKIPVMSEHHIQVDVCECVTCAGLNPVGRALCHFEGGFIAGAVGGILKREVRAKEVRCIGGLGDAECSFELELRKL